MSGTSGSDVEIDLDSSSSEEEVVSEGEDFGANSDDSSDGGENTSEDDKEDHDDVVEDMSEPKKLTKEEPEEQMKVSKKLPNNCGIRPATNRSSAFKRASKRVMKPPVLKKPATQVAALQSPQVQSSPGLHQLDLDPDEDDPMPTANDQAARREENIRAMLDGSLDVSRKPLLPKLLSVQDAAVVLRKPFKSPHPNAPARSEALKRSLIARKQFVPWGAGKPFQAPVKIQMGPDSEAANAPPPDVVELPPGIEPLILWEPPPEATKGRCVRVDDALTRFLRPHQREGVQFMFECVAGLRNFEGNGCILADDMGLGKTLQGIALLWTMLNNGHEALGGEPMARRVIICCPTSLVANWDQECTKWLSGKVKSLPLCESSREDVIATINQFLSPRNPAHLLIVSYETFRLHAERFQGPGSCDLLICDEAHRLKNDQTLTNKALDSLACKRRVLLSGTPMQNQLQEFYAMVNFCNPGILGTPSEFRKRFENPILAGREPDATDESSARGAERSAELSAIVNEFILRRTNSLLSAHLPPKVVEVVCCRMTSLQYDLYCHFVQSRSVRSLFATQKSARALSAIISLRKLLNHPKLIYDMVNSSVPRGVSKSEGGADGFEDAGRLFPPGLFDGSRGGRGLLPLGWEELSGKFAVLARMLALLREQTKDRVVIVSNFTQTLELFTVLCRERGYPCLRLDGSTSIAKRQKLVKRFNDPTDNQFVFLLSSKAGGCGLNLVGGNRLILFDMSWNPADDKQAAARVWRDGQRRRVYVYRFMTTGTIEEKVYQRQLSKEGLQAVVDSRGDGPQSGGEAPMTLEELRDLFSYDPDTLSTTYDHLVAEKGLKKKKRKNNINGKEAANMVRRKRRLQSSTGAESENEDETDVEDVDEEGDTEVSDEEEARKPLRSAALAAAAGSIYKEQEGKPTEDDLAAWGHHSDPTTVPDDLMKLSGGQDVTFVFSCQVDGRDVPPDAPLFPLGLPKAQHARHGDGGMQFAARTAHVARPVMAAVRSGPVSAPANIVGVGHAPQPKPVVAKKEPMSIHASEPIQKENTQVAISSAKSVGAETKLRMKDGNAAAAFQPSRMGHAASQGHAEGGKRAPEATIISKKETIALHSRGPAPGTSVVSASRPTLVYDSDDDFK